MARWVIIFYRNLYIFILCTEQKGGREGGREVVLWVFFLFACVCYIYVGYRFFFIHLLVFSSMLPAVSFTTSCYLRNRYEIETFRTMHVIWLYLQYAPLKWNAHLILYSDVCVCVCVCVCVFCFPHRTELGGGERVRAGDAREDQQQSQIQPEQHRWGCNSWPALYWNTTEDGWGNGRRSGGMRKYSWMWERWNGGENRESRWKEQQVRNVYLCTAVIILACNFSLISSRRKARKNTLIPHF